MSREVRRVPADWQHPKHTVPTPGGWVKRYKPLFAGDDYQRRVDEWDEECAKWKAGWRPDYCDDPESRAMCYEQWEGQRPHRDDYMPNWPEHERTHLMMYESTSEGTPISPAFETPEELAQWLADNKASAFGSMTASYDQWLSTIRAGYAMSAVVTREGLSSGVEAMHRMEDKCTPSTDA